MDIRAVSPNVERHWPADEVTHLEGKVVGLQMKRAILKDDTKGPINYSRLKWSLGSPSWQFPLVQSRPEIYYCLPTFVNRRWKRSALQHTLFWRPNLGDTCEPAWYDNKKGAQGPGSSSTGSGSSLSNLADHANTMRWGRFYERVVSCGAGVEIGGDSMSMSEYLDILSGVLSDQPQGEERNAENNTGGLYLLYLAPFPHFP